MPNSHHRTPMTRLPWPSQLNFHPGCLIRLQVSDVIGTSVLLLNGALGFRVIAL